MKVSTLFGWAAVLVCLAVMVFAPGSASCSPVSAQGGPFGGAPGGWDDLVNRANDFRVLSIEPGVALLVDERTQRAWILAGSSQSWQAIEPVGGL